MGMTTVATAQSSALRVGLSDVPAASQRIEEARLSAAGSEGVVTLPFFATVEGIPLAGHSEIRMNAQLIEPVQEADQRSGWRRGLVIGGLVGVAVGVLLHSAIDNVPCDTCMDGRGAAEGTRLEFAVLFGLVGAGVGALLWR
jgi:hypothetical protein